MSDLTDWFNDKREVKALKAEIVELKEQVAKGKNRECKHKAINKELRARLKK